ncbi:MAG: ATP synthase F0 subunit B [Ruminococcaceae bacterium]|nr:ATP synthase F0 subunit B [Oscillospiraceae bacterium]
MNIDDALEAMDEILDKSMVVPFSQKKGMVDVNALRDLIDDIRMNLPAEITQARKLVDDRKIIISDAKQEADKIIRKAEENAKRLVSQQEITRQANEKATQILTNAQTKYTELCNNTNEYVDSMLTRVEELLSKDLADVKKARTTLKRK